jgi:hypothetical protein
LAFHTHGKARLVALAELVIFIFANVSGKEKVNFSQVALFLDAP